MKYGILALLLSLNSFATDLSPESLLARCYGIFSEQRLPENYPRKSSVTTSNYVDYCMEILNTAKLDSSGKIGIVNDSTWAWRDLGKAVLRTIYENHNEFVSSDNLAENSRDLASFFGTWKEGSDFYDHTIHALYLTYALLKDGIKYDFIVTDQSTLSLDGIREGSPNTGTTPPWPAGSTCNGVFAPFSEYCKGVPGFGNNGWFQWDSTSKALTAMTVRADHFVPSGELIGIKYMDLGRADLQVRAQDVVNPVVVQKHRGGGILGTPAYLLTHLTYTYYPDGGIQNQRKWVKSVFKDFLCRDLPVLASNHVDPIGGNLPFQQSSSCMQCHTTMEPMAKAVRNLRRSITGPDSDDTSTLMVVSEAAATGTDSDTTLANWLRKPIGSLIFTDYLNSSPRKQLSFTGNDTTEALNSLGSQIAALPDFYVCAANKYLKFLTGVEVDLNEIGPINTTSSASPNQAYKNLIDKLGRCFQMHKNPQKLIRQIIDSSMFRDPTMRLSTDAIQSWANSIQVNTQNCN